MLTVIAAVDRAGAIGRGGTIPWDIPSDLKFFQRETEGGALIMGRRTWESLPFKPLKRRLNCVVSRDRNCAEAVFSSVTDAIEHACQQGCLRVYAMGGSRIYEEALPLAQRLVLSSVDTTVEGADTWFPSYADSDWRHIRTIPISDDEPRCEAREYLRR